MTSKQFGAITINVLNGDSDKQEFLEQERQRAFGMTECVDMSFWMMRVREDSEQKAVDVQPDQLKNEEWELRRQ